jgi:hypothetical protein
MDSNGSLAQMIKRSSNEIVNEVYYEEVRDESGRAFPTMILAPRPIQTPFFEDLLNYTPEEDVKTPPERTYYTTKKGDNLSKIAKVYGTTVSELLRLNPFVKNKNLIQPNVKFLVKEKSKVVNKKKPSVNLAPELKGAYETLQDLSRHNFVEISQAEIKFENIGKDDHSRFNMFWLTTQYGIEHQFNPVANVNFKKQLANPAVLVESLERHGLKRFEECLEFCHPTGKGSGTATGSTPEILLYQAFMAQIYDMHFANHLYDAGTIETTGVLEAELGKALVVAKNKEVDKAPPKIYFIEGYEHNWSFPTGWTTIFTVTHGQFQVENGNKDIFIDASAGDFGQPDSLIDVAYVAKSESKR